MSTRKSPNLFRQGLAVEVKLFFLVVLCLILLVVDANWSVLNPVRRAAGNILYPIERLVMSPRDLVSDIYTWSAAIKNANTENTQRQRESIENARMRATQAQLASENNQLRRLLSIKESVNFASVAVEILYTPAHPLNQTIIFTKGESDGIRPGMPVISEGGIVGQIRRVNSHTSEALMVTSEKISIPAMVQRNGLRVIVFGTDQPNRVEVRYLSNDADIKAGDVLVTSGIGGYYPAGLTIAEVDSVESNSAQGFALAVAKPVAQPDRYRHFLVLLTDENQRAVTENVQALESSPQPVLRSPPLPEAAAAAVESGASPEASGQNKAAGTPPAPESAGPQPSTSNSSAAGPAAAGRKQP